MRKIFIPKIIIAVVIFQSIFFNINTTNAANGGNIQPPVCNGPSEMMSNYFNFQKEMKSVLLGSDIEERRFNVSAGKGWLFSNGTLKLPSALDFIASNVVGGAVSTAYTAGASTVLLLMASSSILQSNTEGFAILFKDRPIVRDYKTMLDIESELFDLAYFRSKHMNLTAQLDKEETYDKLNKVIEKYQGLGLLYKGSNPGKLQKTESLAKILEELISMNSAMKHFILFWGAPGKKSLENYNGCFGNSSADNCKIAPIIKFDSGAINTLVEDYSGIGTFGACNLSLSNFKNSIKKSIKNNSSSVRAAFDDVKKAINNLKSALLGQPSDGKSVSKTGDSRCNNMSAYEIAQLRAYWGPKWNCGNLVDVSVQISLPKEFIRNKAAENKQRKKNNNLLKRSSSTNMTNTDLNLYEDIKGGDTNLKILQYKKKTTKEREDYWFQLYGTGNIYNQEFLFDFANNYLIPDYVEIMGNYNQIQRDASSSDLSYELKSIRGLLDELTIVINSAIALKSLLEKVAKYQCIF